MIRHVTHCPWCFDPVFFNNDIDNLCLVFTWAAVKTWRDLGDSYRFGGGISEDSITDMLLLEMRRRTKHLAYRRYNRHEEHGSGAPKSKLGTPRTSHNTRHKEHGSGADWLWWFVSGNRGFPLLVQAKRLYPKDLRYGSPKDLRYGSLKYKKSKRSDQTNTLLRYAKNKKYLPVFCFYNYWDSPQSWTNAPGPISSPHWGCAVASATSIKKLMLAHGNKGNKLLYVGPKSIPWHYLVCPLWDVKQDTTPDKLPDLVQRTMMLGLDLSLREVPPVTDGLPPKVRQLLEGSIDDERVLEPLENFPSLKGMIVVSDRPIER